MEGGVETINEISSLAEAKVGGEWYKLSLSGSESICPRMGHSLLPNNGPHKLLTLIGGGSHEGAMNDIWKVDVGGDVAKIKQLSPVEGLKPKYEFLATVAKCREETKRSRIWIFGGADSVNTFNDVGYLENGIWVEAGSGESNKPTPRTQGANSTVVEIGEKEYLCVFSGGQSGVDAVTDGQLYLFDLEEQNWLTVKIQNDNPPLTQGHVTTTFGSKIYLHGGLNGSTLHETLYMIDVANCIECPSKSCSWIPVEIGGGDNVPKGRAAHGIAKSENENEGNKFYIFGGLGQRGCLGDLWLFDIDSNIWKELGKASCVKPSPRFGMAMTSINLKNERNELSTFVIVHGGINGDGELFNDTWVFKVEN